MNKEIILNHMFTGDYLDGNIGHEIINLYDDDKGDRYIYLCSDGRFNASIHSIPEAVILVRRPYKSRNLLEIIGVARKLEPLVDPVKIQENIKYGGVPVTKIFTANSSQQNICVTFKAGEFLWPSIPLYIYHGKNVLVDVSAERINKDIHILDPFSPSRIMREYFKDTTKNYNILSDIIAKGSWEKKETRITQEDLDKSYPVSSMEIYGIQHRELSFSNAFRCFLLRFPEILSEFVDFLKCPNININVNSNNKYIVEREKYHTDILIKADNTVIVVENKIFSDINGKTLGNQLSEYEAKIANKFKGHEQHFYILVPDHNDLKIPVENSNWKKIPYSKINDFLESQDINCKNDFQLRDFQQTISDHSQKDYNYSIMRKKFIRAIKSVNKGNMIKESR